jgi:predicted outer membrane lipoprotein
MGVGGLATAFGVLRHLYYEESCDFSKYEEEELSEECMDQSPRIVSFYFKTMSILKKTGVAKKIDKFLQKKSRLHVRIWGD